MIEVGYLANKEIGLECLKILIDKAPSINTQIKYVVTSGRMLDNTHHETLASFAIKNEIPVFHNSEDIIKSEQVDFLISVQFHEILKPPHLKMARKQAFNLHMAPLPEYRGCNQFSFAIIDEAETFGTTWHILNEKIDGGDVLFERRFKIEKESTVTELYDKTFLESVILFQDNIERLLNQDYTSIPQLLLSRERKTGFHLRKEIDIIKKIDLSWDKNKIMKHFRATYFPPFPPPYAMVNGIKVEITPDWIRDNLK